jgi:hypothetical protein
VLRPGNRGARGDVAAENRCAAADIQNRAATHQRLIRLSRRFATACVRLAMRHRNCFRVGVRPRHGDVPAGFIGETLLLGIVCGIHTRKSRGAVPRRDKCGGERIKYHDRGKEEGRPWLVGPAALSARTLEERLVLSPGADE